MIKWGAESVARLKALAAAGASAREIAAVMGARSPDSINQACYRHGVTLVSRRVTVAPPRRVATAWPPERLAELARLAAAGLSSAAIGRALGGASRAAVIGACHRRGIALALASNNSGAPGAGRRWTPEAVAALRAMAGAGLDGAAIARALGDGFAPAMIMAKCRIAGIALARAAAPARAGRPAGVAPRAPAIKARAKNPPAKNPGNPDGFGPTDRARRREADATPPPPFAERAAAVAPLRVALADLDMFRDCRWPLGDPRAADFAYCGLPQAAPGACRAPYCAGHRALATQPPERRRCLS